MSDSMKETFALMDELGRSFDSLLDNTAEFAEKRKTYMYQAAYKEYVAMGEFFSEIFHRELHLKE